MAPAFLISLLPSTSGPRTHSSNIAPNIWELGSMSVATLTLGSRLRQRGRKVASQKGAQESFRMLLGVQERASGNEPSHSQREFNFGSWSLGALLNLQKDILGVKIPCLEEFFIPLESS
jgi:hypothetical protein